MNTLDSSEVQKFLGRINPFKELARNSLEELGRAAQPKTFKKGETIYNEGDAADSVWILHTGRIQVYKYTSDSKPLAIESLGPGELFGTLCRLGGEGRTYPCTAVASEPTLILQIPDPIFLKHYNESPGLVRGMCSLCSQRLKDVQDLRCTGQEPVPFRLAATLLRLKEVHGLTLPFTKREVSELIGATLETTFRALADFQKKGYLSSLRGKILLKKPEALRSLIEKI